MTGAEAIIISVILPFTNDSQIPVQFFNFRHNGM